jgi:N-glycosylase/DNA lyase
MSDRLATVAWPVTRYDLDVTLASGQTFGWKRQGDSWTGVVQGRWVRLRSVPGAIPVATPGRPGDWRWLRDYLQLDAPLERITATFPKDPWMQAAMAACPGLRLLRQEPWECLASFILSSTKRIAQIEQVSERLRARFGKPVPVPSGEPPAWAFPSAERLAACAEAELRACKLGFRAPYLLAAARFQAEGKLDWNQLGRGTLGEAREQLMRIPGVGRKIADCALLFTGLFPEAFPVDVWIERTLRAHYFPKGRATPREIERFTASYFGPYAGYAQQYLFHYARTQGA